MLLPSICERIGCQDGEGQWCGTCRARARSLTILPCRHSTFPAPRNPATPALHIWEEMITRSWEENLQFLPAPRLASKVLSIEKITTRKNSTKKDALTVYDCTSFMIQLS